MALHLLHSFIFPGNFPVILPLVLHTAPEPPLLPFQPINYHPTLWGIHIWEYANKRCHAKGIFAAKGARWSKAFHIARFNSCVCVQVPGGLGSTQTGPHFPDFPLPAARRCTPRPLPAARLIRRPVPRATATIRAAPGCRYARAAHTRWPAAQTRTRGARRAEGVAVTRRQTTRRRQAPRERARWRTAE